MSTENEPIHVLTILDMRAHIRRGDMNLDLSHSVRVAVNGFLVVHMGITIEQAQAMTDKEVVEHYKREFIDA